MICDENKVRCHEACLLVTSFTSCLLYHLIIYHQSFLKFTKEKRKRLVLVAVTTSFMLLNPKREKQRLEKC